MAAIYASARRKGQVMNRRSALALGMSALCLGSGYAAAASSSGLSPQVALPAPTIFINSITMNDLLTMTHVQEVSFSPSGADLLFSTLVPMKGSRNLGFDNAEWRVWQKIFIKRGEEPVVEISPPPDFLLAFAKRDPWLGEGGAILFLAVNKVTYGANLAVYELATGKLTLLAPAPLDPVAAILGNHLAYAASSTPPAHSQGPAVLARIGSLWRQNWFEGGAPATVSSNMPELAGSSRQEVGSLLSYDRSTGKTQTLSELEVQLLETSPDGRLLAAAGKNSGGDHVIEVFRQRGDRLVRSRSWTVPGSKIRSMSWSPHSDKLLALAFPHEGETTEIWEIALAEGQPVPLLSAGAAAKASIGVEVGAMGWLDGVPIASIAHDRADGSQGYRLHSLGLRGRQLSTKTDDIKAFLAAPSGKYALFVSGGALWRIKPDGQSERLTPEALLVNGFAPQERIHFTARAQERIALSASIDGEARVVVWDILKGDAALSSPARAESWLSLQSLTTAEIVRSGWTSTLESQTRLGARHVVARFNDHLATKGAGEVREFTYLDEGVPYKGWVVLPPGYEGRERLPAILFVYGGHVWERQPSYATAGESLPVFSGQALAAQGYAVVYPSLPMPEGESMDLPKHFHRLATAAVDSLASSGLVDPARVGLMGQSFGGYTAAAILSADEGRYRAGVSLAGIYDLIYAHGNPSLRQTFSDDGGMMDFNHDVFEKGLGFRVPPWRDPEMYVRNSPYFRVENIRAPLLLLHGDLDLGPTSDRGGQRMYDAMRRSGGRAVLVRYHGEGHVAKSEGVVRDQWTRITSWFRSHLRNEQLP